MIYRIYNPSLDSAAGEANHAYMFMSKEVLPMGMLGLMVGAMIFATASSVSTTLNIVSGVFTNDIYKNLKKKAGDRELIFVARTSTAIFGLLTMIIALSVDRMGGILSVIWAVAGVTGGAMYIPTLWALFSKRHTGVSVLTTTLVCLSVNSFFKWGGLFDLTRAQTQALGSILPLTLMALYEIYASMGKPVSQQYLNYENARLARENSERDPVGNEEEAAEARRENCHGIKVIGLGVISTGLLIVILGAFAQTGTALVSTVGIVVTIVGWIIFNKR
jgi:Na+/proline symporter